MPSSHAKENREPSPEATKRRESVDRGGKRNKLALVSKSRQHYASFKGTLDTKRQRAQSFPSGELPSLGSTPKELAKQHRNRGILGNCSEGGNRVWIPNVHYTFSTTSSTQKEALPLDGTVSPASSIDEMSKDPASAIAALRRGDDRANWMIFAARFRRNHNPSAAILILSAMIDYMVDLGHTEDDLKPAHLMLSGCEADMAKSLKSEGSPEKCTLHYNNAANWLRKAYGSFEVPALQDYIPAVKGTTESVETNEPLCLPQRPPLMDSTTEILPIPGIEEGFHPSWAWPDSKLPSAGKHFQGNWTHYRNTGTLY